MNKYLKYGLIGFAVIYGLGVIGQLSHPLPPAAAPTSVETAKYLCKQAVLSSLNDPDSAEFDPSHTWRVVENDAKDKAVIYPTLRAKNAFNATVKGEFSCHVTTSPGVSIRELREM